MKQVSTATSGRHLLLDKTFLLRRDPPATSPTLRSASGHKTLGAQFKSTPSCRKILAAQSKPTPTAAQEEPLSRRDHQCSFQRQLLRGGTIILPSTLPTIHLPQTPQVPVNNVSPTIAKQPLSLQAEADPADQANRIPSMIREINRVSLVAVHFAKDTRVTKAPVL
jgi:hypothetical protein